jgi:hypothetical protein
LQRRFDPLFGVAALPESYGDRGGRRNAGWSCLMRQCYQSGFRRIACCLLRYD